MLLNVSVYCQSVVSVLSVYCQMMIINEDSFFGWKMKNILASVLSVMLTSGKIMPVCCQCIDNIASASSEREIFSSACCQSIVSVLSDVRLCCQCVVSLLSVCCHSVVSVLSETFLVRDVPGFWLFFRFFCTNCIGQISLQQHLKRCM